MKDKDWLHELAIKYFSGTLAYEEEVVLFQFIKEETNGMQQFRQWEQEWKASEGFSVTSDEAWRQVRRKMQTSDAAVAMLAPMRNRWWQKVISIAAIIVLTVLGTWFVMQWTDHMQTESYYLCSVAYGEKSKLVLADGTKVWLNAGSSLKYSNCFGDTHREVFLDGEGYFEVSKSIGRKFTVHTDSYDVVVKGTKFNISAYADDSVVVTTLIEGMVDITYGDKVMSMNPGEKISFNRTDTSFARSQVDAFQAMAWAENRIEYSDITLRELVIKLSRQYDVSIRLDLSSADLAEKEIRISLRNSETLDDVLMALEQILPISVVRNGKNVVIK